MSVVDRHQVRASTAARADFYSNHPESGCKVDRSGRFTEDSGKATFVVSAQEKQRRSRNRLVDSENNVIVSREQLVATALM